MQNLISYDPIRLPSFVQTKSRSFFFLQGGEHIREELKQKLGHKMTIQTNK